MLMIVSRIINIMLFNFVFCWTCAQPSVIKKTMLSGLEEHQRLANNCSFRVTLVLKKIFAYLMEVLFPSLTKKVERERWPHGELGQPAGDLAHLDQTAVWHFWREGPAVTNVFFLLCPLLRKEIPQWKPTCYLINYVCSSFALHFLFCVLHYIHPIVSHSFLGFHHFPPSSPTVSLLCQLHISFIPVVFLTNLFLRALIRFHLFFVPRFTSSLVFDWSGLVFLCA